ncbi:MAG: hypothetical protein E5V91_04010 [Mesorhizobium sp.]|uniref:hypothetical protein n=1 Tax=Mesorhizobium sp. TaxID=1871066 RepID=UPI000FE9FC0A|nr:MAG: hypothetical protein EOQ48_04115 [Mesorhizobium sp.]TIV41310.1 MAG: hypothetical protein E5V91_04010 [Mesorhizobium sp.]
MMDIGWPPLNSTNNAERPEIVPWGGTDVASLARRFGPGQPCLHWELLKIIYCSECRAAGRDDRNLQFTKML